MSRKKNNKTQFTSELLEELLADDLEATSSKSNPAGPLNQKYILKQLKSLADKGNVKALELLGKHFEIFDKNKGASELLDIFASEDSLEENILKYLDILEDKYSEDVKGSLHTLLNTEDLYKERDPRGRKPTADSLRRAEAREAEKIQAEINRLREQNEKNFESEEGQVEQFPEIDRDRVVPESSQRINPLRRR